MNCQDESLKKKRIKSNKSVNKILAVTFAPMMCECELIWMSRSVLNVDDDGSVSYDALRLKISLL